MKAASQRNPSIDLASDQMAPAGAKKITDLSQLIYVSQPFGYDSATLAGILIDARRFNARDDITGALICRQDVYMQLLEGPSEALEAAYNRICRDDRHTAVQKLVSRTISTRMFGAWAMLHDPAKSLIWTRDEISAGVLERISTEEILGVFESIAATVGSGPSD